MARRIIYQREIIVEPEKEENEGIEPITYFFKGLLYVLLIICAVIYFIGYFIYEFIRKRLEESRDGENNQIRKSD